MTPSSIRDPGQELAASIAETRGLLATLPAGSGEYPLVKKTLIRQLIRLALLSLDGRDRWGLVSALRDLADIAGDPGNRLMTACRDIETLKINECGLSEGIKNRVRGLLREVEERAAERPDHR